MWASFQLAAVLSNIIYTFIDINNEFTFREKQTQQICYGTDSSEGIIYSPEFTSSSNYTTSEVANVTFCNLPTLYWLHLDYTEKVTPKKCFSVGNTTLYIIRDGPGLLNKTESCSNGIYSWKILQFNESTVNLTLPATEISRSTFRIGYKSKCYATLFVPQYCIL